MNGQEVHMGQKLSFPMDKDYRAKSKCASKAEYIKANCFVNGNLTALELAQEIFAHAVAYYSGASFPNVPVASDIASWLIQHGDPIDLDSDGDTAIRRAAYTAIWNLFGDSF
jgi:hypothetical protein